VSGATKSGALAASALGRIAPGTRLLVVDDEAPVVEFLTEQLRARGFIVDGCTAAPAALEAVRAAAYDLVISDIEMPELRGIELLQAIQQVRPEQLVLLITAFGSVDVAVQAVRAGACDFLAKPFPIDALVLAVERALRERLLRREVIRLRRTQPLDTPSGLVARSAAMRRALTVAQRAARSDTTVLLTGETGTGKDALARYIHAESARRARPFVAVNCGALPAPLAEAELFGVRRGAFTDARESRAGMFVAASDGTLFLDEVGDLSLDVQVKLLQALESGRVRPLGGTAEVTANARVVAATNRPLERLLREGRFRPDLYYRLNVIRIELPPLRERREDIVPLVDLFLARAVGDGPVLGVSAAAMRRLVAHAWPGNVRELANVIARAVALCEHDVILPEDLGLDGADRPADTAAAGAAEDELVLEAPSQRLETVELAHIRRVLAAHGGNKAAAARALGINRRTLDRRLRS
jgi:DNA-binding NtrC family response regulator